MFSRVSELSIMKSFYYLMSSGVPVAEIARELSQRIRDRAMSEKLHVLSDLITREGLTISKAIEHVGLFQKYIQLIQVGEKTGNLSGVFKDIIDTVEDIERIKKKVKSSLYYPAGVVVISIALSFGLVSVLKKILESLNFPSMQTMFAYKAGWFIVNNKYIIFPVYITALAALVVVAGKNMHRIPGVKDLYNKISIGQAFKVISLCLSSGLTPSDAFRNAAMSVRGMWQDLLDSLSTEVQHRSTLDVIEEMEPYIPTDYYLVLRARIKSGDMAGVFSVIAKDFLTSAFQKMEALSGFITIFAFLFVAGQIVVVMSPIWGVIFSFMGTASVGKF